MEKLRSPDKRNERLEYNKKRTAQCRTNRRKSVKLPVACKSLSDFDEKKVHTHDIGNMCLTCNDCGALMFQQEKSEGLPSGGNTKFSLCCRKGSIKLPPIKEPPEVLQ